MIGKIGCRAHDYGQGTIEEIASMVSQDHYQTTQLALKKALNEKTDVQSMLTTDFMSYVANGLEEKSIDVSVFGAYLNYAHPEDGIRQANVEILKGHLKVAGTLGCRMVGTETGSLDVNYKAHPMNHGNYAYERFVDAIVSVMPTTEACNTYMAVEAVAHHIIHTPERMKQLVDDVGHKRLKVIFDINNLITQKNHMQQDALINQMFDLMENQIWAVHVKDYKIIDGEKIIVPIGEGDLNLDLLMKRVKLSGETVDVLAENIQRDLLAETYYKLTSYID